MRFSLLAFLTFFSIINLCFCAPNDSIKRTKRQDHLEDSAVPEMPPEPPQSTTLNDELPDEILDYSPGYSKTNNEESPTEKFFKKYPTAQRISVSPNSLSKQQSQYQTNMMAGYSQQHQIPQQYQPPQQYQQPQQYQKQQQQYYSPHNPDISQYQSEYHVSKNQMQYPNAMPPQKPSQTQVPSYPMPNYTPNKMTNYSGHQFKNLYPYQYYSAQRQSVVQPVNKMMMVPMPMMNPMMQPQMIVLYPYPHASHSKKSHQIVSTEPPFTTTTLEPPNLEDIVETFRKGSLTDEEFTAAVQAIEELKAKREKEKLISEIEEANRKLRNYEEEDREEADGYKIVETKEGSNQSKYKNKKNGKIDKNKIIERLSKEKAKRKKLGVSKVVNPEDELESVSLDDYPEIPEIEVNNAKKYSNGQAKKQVIIQQINNDANTNSDMDIDDEKVNIIKNQKKEGANRKGKDNNIKANLTEKHGTFILSKPTQKIKATLIPPKPKFLMRAKLKNLPTKDQGTIDSWWKQPQHEFCQDEIFEMNDCKDKKLEKRWSYNSDDERCYLYEDQCASERKNTFESLPECIKTCWRTK